MISNGSSGFYHTGSRSRLYGTDLEDTIYSTPPKLPPKIDLYCEIPTPKLQVKSDNSTLTRREHNSTLTRREHNSTLTRRESTSRTIASSVYSKCWGTTTSELPIPLHRLSLYTTDIIKYGLCVDVVYQYEWTNWVSEIILLRLRSMSIFEENFKNAGLASVSHSIKKMYMRSKNKIWAFWEITFQSNATHYCAK